MKKALFLIMGLVLISIAIADKPNNNGVGPIDEECSENGFGFGIAKWEWENGYFLDEGGNVTVYGDAVNATWESSVYVSGVVSKAGQDYHIYDGGFSGRADQITHEISHLTFCGNENEVPEFGTIAALTALVGAIGVFFVSRRH